MSRYRQRPTRLVLRRLLGGLTALSLVVPAAACGFVGGSSGQDTLVFGGFGGSMETAMKEKVIPAFEKEYDVKVTYVVGTSDELMAKARSASSNIDVVWTNDSTHFDGKKEDLFAELDKDIVDNLQDVYQVARDPENIGVTTGIQALGLTYNTDVFKEKGWKPPTSWNDLADNRFAGHIVGYNFPIGYSNLLLVQLATMNGGGPDDLEPGWEVLEKFVPKAAAWVSPPAQMQSLLADGTGWLAYNGSARTYAAIAAGDPVDFVYPDEGAIAYPQYFDVLKSAPHPDLAQEFVNFALREDSQTGMAEGAMMGPVNATTELTDDVAETVPDGAEEIEGMRFIDSDHVNNTLDKVTDRWTRLAGGA